MIAPLKCLRPCIRPCNQPGPRSVSAYIRFYSAVQAQFEPRIRKTHDLEYPQGHYPRIKSQEAVLDFTTFRERYRGLKSDESKVGEEVVVRGRIWSFRVAGSKLAFIDLFHNTRQVELNNQRLQCVVNFGNLSDRILTESGVTPSQFKAFLYALHRGDVFSVKGIPHRTARNELSILATELPQLLSRCIQALPDNIQNQETKMRNRHVDLLLNPRPGDMIRLRSGITNFLRQFLSENGHVEVQTPILADAAGGAVAKPFHTIATEFQDRRISLRIAPELWLKRLILGGFEKVFEIGPSFRNEGIDLNHNPEFTTCEFYRTYAGLEELIDMTERMFLNLSRTVNALIDTDCRSLKPSQIDFSPPYQRLDFIPAIESLSGRQLPDLTSPEAESALIILFNDCQIPLPSLPTLPRLLDKLSSTYLEPQCFEPTWIINPPECLSPLSKSFTHPQNQQRVSARAELFVKKQELVNTYEEENSPFEQRRKFKEQLRHHDAADPEAGIDENYLEALEWGLPPTGGWGCGIDRLCMLFGGTNRIADVLSFGTLRNVVALGQASKKP